MTPPGSGSPSTLELRLPARPEAVADARGALVELAEDLEPVSLENLRLLVSELVTNAIRHGPKGAEVALSVALQGDTVRVEVTDPGEGFAPPDGPRANGAGGWGLLLVDRLADRWGVADGAPTRVWLEIDGARRREIPESPWPASLDPILLDRLGAAVIATDLEGVVTRWNRHAEELFGHRAEETIGRKISELLLEPDDQAAAEVLLQRVRAGETWEGEWLAPRRDGTRIWVRVANSPVHDEHGSLLGMLGLSVDITEREREQAALRESEERLRIALGGGRMGTWDWDVRGGSVRWSESLEAIHGLAPGTFDGTFEGSNRDVHPEDRSNVLAAIERAVNQGDEYVLDYRIVRPDGAVRWLSARGSVFRDRGGKPVRMAGVCTDITERKEAERSLDVQVRVSRVLAEAPTVEEATPELIRAICEPRAWELGILWKVDEEARVLRYVGGWHHPTSSAAAFLAKSRELVFESGETLPGFVWANRRPYWIPDVADEHGLQRASLATAEGLHSTFAFPVTLGREVLGVMEFFSRRIREPDEPLLELTATVGAQIGQFLERKDAEEQVAQSEARKAAILDSALEAIITMDEEGTLLELNPAACEMFGLEAETAVGHELAGLIMPERYRERHRASLARYRQTGRGRILGRRLELVGMRSDGSEFPVELTITRGEVPGAGPVLFTGYLRDITNRKRVEELQGRLLENERAAREQLETANERMTFLADASVILASSLDYRKTLGKVARLSVPRLADWCSVDMVDSDGSIQSVAVAHVDPEKVSLAREYVRRYPPRPESADRVAAAIRDGEPELFPEGSDRAIDDPERQELVRRLGLRSAMIVPLVARGRALGAITFASAESERTFSEADLEFAQDLARRAALSIDNARLYEERSHVARTLQRTLLPRRLPDVPGVEVAAFYRPAGLMQTEVGGDFYDVFEAGDETWGLVIGDVCGKGVEAAALTGLARHTVRAAAMREPSPAEILADLNEVLILEDGDRFCTVALGRLETHEAGARLTVSCGGHPMPLVLRTDGRVEALGSPGSLLGVFDEVELQDRTAELLPGDLVVFFTDGLIDARHPTPMDEAALLALVESCREFDAQQAADRLGDAVADPRGEAPDDVALLVLRVSPDRSPRLTRRRVGRRTGRWGTGWTSSRPRRRERATDT